MNGHDVQHGDWSESLPPHVRRAIADEGWGPYPTDDLWGVPAQTERPPGLTLRAAEKDERRQAVRVILAGRPHIGPSECRRILGALGYEVSLATASKDLKAVSVAITGRPRAHQSPKAKKFTVEQAQAVARDHRPARVIAEEYGCCATTVIRVRRRETYKSATRRMKEP